MESHSENACLGTHLGGTNPRGQIRYSFHDRIRDLGPRPGKTQETRRKNTGEHKQNTGKREVIRSKKSYSEQKELFGTREVIQSKRNYSEQEELFATR